MELLLAIGRALGVMELGKGVPTGKAHPSPQPQTLLSDTVGDSPAQPQPALPGSRGLPSSLSSPPSSCLQVSVPGLAAARPSLLGSLCKGCPAS